MSVYKKPLNTEDIHVSTIHKGGISSGLKNNPLIIYTKTIVLQQDRDSIISEPIMKYIVLIIQLCRKDNLNRNLKKYKRNL